MSARPPTGTLLIALPALLCGCSTVQSVMAPASELAERTWTLGLVMIVAGTAIFMGVMALTVLAWRGTDAQRSRIASRRTVFAGGVIFPSVVLTLLLAYGLVAMRPLPSTASAQPDITVEGNQWWWRVTYHGSDQPLHDANELHVPAGRPVRIALTSADVIHSFWVPALAGKADMIPGKTNVLQFTGAKAGIYRGQCAEYCGGAHALMALHVIVHEAEAYDAWLSKMKTAPPPPQNDNGQRGQQLFLSRGCAACHTIMRTAAVGKLGPDLTRVGSRSTIAAGTLPTTEKNVAHWIAANDVVKPNNMMPPYGSLPRDEIDALATYLMSLK
jgi:cytochrome c oxidase subunit II